MNHSTKIRLRACALLLLSALTARGQVHDGWEKVEYCNQGRDQARISYIQFFDNQNGLIAGDGGFIRYTRNGGVTWRQPTLPATLSRPNVPFAEHILTGSRVAGGRRGQLIYLVTGQRLLRSRDKGANWELMKTPFPPGHLSVGHGGSTIIEYYDVAFANEVEGWVLCGVLKKVANREPDFIRNYVLYTDDAGQSWEPTPLPLGILLVRMHFADSTRGWIVGDKGTILYTEDGGRNWNPQKYPVAERPKVAHAKPKLLDVHFRGKERGIIVGKMGTILKTTDGGRRWSAVAPPSIQGQPEIRDLSRVQMTDDDHAWIVGYGGIIFSTDNGGQSWLRQGNPVKESLFAIFMQDRRHGWAAGDRRTILRLDAVENMGRLSPDGDNHHTTSARGRKAMRRVRHE